MPRLVLRSANQDRPSMPAFLSLICFSGLKRCSSQVRPYDIQSPAWASAARMVWPFTAAGSASAARAQRPMSAARSAVQILRMPLALVAVIGPAVTLAAPVLVGAGDQIAVDGLDVVLAEDVGEAGHAL